MTHFADASTGRGYHRVRYSDDTVEQARQMHDEGIGMTTIGRRLGVSQYTVRDWIEYRTRTRLRPSRPARMLTEAIDGIRQRQGETAIFMSRRGEILPRAVRLRGNPSRAVARLMADPRYHLVGVYPHHARKEIVDAAINEAADEWLAEAA